MVIDQWSGFGLEKHLGLVPEWFKIWTHCFGVGQTRTHICDPAGNTSFGKTCWFQSTVLVIGFFYLWSHSNMQLLIAKC